MNLACSLSDSILISIRSLRVSFSSMAVSSCFCNSILALSTLTSSSRERVIVLVEGLFPKRVLSSPKSLLIPWDSGSYSFAGCCVWISLFYS